MKQPSGSHLELRVVGGVGGGGGNKEAKLVLEIVSVNSLSVRRLKQIL